MTALGGASAATPDACLGKCRGQSQSHKEADFDSLYRGISQTHKHVPLLLLSNCREPSSNLVIPGQFLELGNGLVLGFDGLSKCDTSGSVFMSVVYDRAIGKGTQIRKCSVHFRADAFEKATTAC